MKKRQVKKRQVKKRQVRSQEPPAAPPHAVVASDATVRTKAELEVELLREQIQAARAESHRLNRPAWKRLSIYATLLGGVLTPVILAAWSVSSAAWAAPLEEAAVKAREEGLTAREALRQLREQELAINSALFERKRLLWSILQEFHAYRLQLTEATRSGSLAYFESAHEVVTEQMSRLKQCKDNDAARVGSFLQDDENVLRPRLEEELRRERDLLVEALLVRSKWAAALKAGFRVEEYKGEVPFQTIISEPEMVAISDRDHLGIIAAAARAHADHRLLVESLLKEADTFKGWATAKTE